MANGQTQRRTSLVLPVVLGRAWRNVSCTRTGGRRFDPWPILRNLLAADSGICRPGEKCGMRREPRQNADGTPRSGGVSLGATFGAFGLRAGPDHFVRAWPRVHQRIAIIQAIYQHQTRTVDRQGAKSVDVSMETGSGGIEYQQRLQSFA